MDWRRTPIAWLLLAMLAGGAALPAAAADPATAQRDRITAERAVADARRDERERECRTLFAVTACVEAARREHRTTVAELRRQQTVLDEAARRERALERVNRLAAKRAASGPTAREPREPREPRELGEAQAREPRHGKPPGDAAQASVSAASAGVPSPAPVARRTPPGIASAGAVDARRAKEDARAAAFAARKEAAAARRAEVERRHAQRVQSGKVKPPLPVPASAAAP